MNFKRQEHFQQLDWSPKSDSQAIVTHYEVFFEMVAYGIAAMKNEFGKFECDIMQQRPKRGINYEKDVFTNI
jgi:hypothetical protein